MMGLKEIYDTSTDEVMIRFYRYKLVGLPSMRLW